MHSIVYNVLIGGTSVGLTFDKREALNWLARSSFQGSKVIVPVPYSGEF